MNLIAWMIIACEIAFWIVIILGLATRYMFKKQKLSFFILALTPVVDFFLLIVTSVDLYRGATATYAHAIAAVYIGISIAFGKSMIQWADERFQYYVIKSGEKPRRRYGKEYAKHYFKSWIQHLVAYAIGAALLAAMMHIVPNGKTNVLQNVVEFWTVIVGIDFLLSLSNFVWPKKEKESGYTNS
ncbi:hypothetical protein ABET11_19775 [Priestia megaterium]|uniref:hypothetical protein n=1 Tax=Priestia TaxID=2800373 RepID=UPI000BF612CD|nr:MULTISPECIES: hypothetical protein [Priestia]MEB2273815.1 hypothetical protein [Bacillus sp. ILBB4]MBU8586588.1 hypothetical protein [Priestia megaterium]MDH2453491.1 hypothetical protein [Priestia megaterium]MDL5152948.1 hypothetical protein [Priestia megaterium]MDP9724378.1 hypothetical protein [Priestia aryabhattai]